MSHFAEYGFDAVIVKPWTVREISEVLRRVLVADPVRRSSAVSFEYLGWQNFSVRSLEQHLQEGPAELQISPRRSEFVTFLYLPV